MKCIFGSMQQNQQLQPQQHFKQEQPGTNIYISKSKYNKIKSLAEMMMMSPTSSHTSAACATFPNKTSNGKSKNRNMHVAPQQHELAAQAQTQTTFMAEVFPEQEASMAQQALMQTHKLPGNAQEAQPNAAKMPSTTSTSVACMRIISKHKHQQKQQIPKSSTNVNCNNNSSSISNTTINTTSSTSKTTSCCSSNTETLSSLKEPPSVKENTNNNSNITLVAGSATLVNGEIVVIDTAASMHCNVANHNGNDDDDNDDNADLTKVSAEFLFAKAPFSLSATSLSSSSATALTSSTSSSSLCNTPPPPLSPPPLTLSAANVTTTKATTAQIYKNSQIRNKAQCASACLSTTTNTIPTIYKCIANKSECCLAATEQHKQQKQQHTKQHVAQQEQNNCKSRKTSSNNSNTTTIRNSNSTITSTTSNMIGQYKNTDDNCNKISNKSSSSWLHANALLTKIFSISQHYQRQQHRHRSLAQATVSSLVSKKVESILRTFLFGFMFILSTQFQSVAASTSMMNKHEPMFISRSETFKFVAGDTIVLPCEVANTDPYVVAWKRGIAILTAGSVKVTPDPRVRLINGFNLQIRDAVPQDAGDYICQIATMEPREITHTVEILVPPRIHHISTSGHLQVKKGSSVRIECSASGNPTPNVTWSRKNNILPNGEEKLHSHILSIENVDRHKGGVYICTANNGVGQPASSQVVLHVLYPPEITVERPVVFSGEGHEAMLVCIVHGETQPEVIWFKDTMQLDTTERHIMENRGSRHTLIIRKVHPQDFGNYSCVAENQLGKSRKTLQLSGKPNVAVFNSPPISQYKDRYNISWTVESHAPIEEYKLSFRRLQQGQEVDNSIDTHSSLPSSSQSLTSSSSLQMYGGGSMSANIHNYRGMGGLTGINGMGMGSSGGYGGYGAGNVIHWGRNDWRDVVLPAIPVSHHYTQGMSYMIRGLDPDQHYEATVQARNRYGWSEYSQSFVFSTSSNDNEMRDLGVTFYGGSGANTKSNLLIILMTAIAFFAMKLHLRI